MVVSLLTLHVVQSVAEVLDDRLHVLDRQGVFGDLGHVAANPHMVNGGHGNVEGEANITRTAGEGVHELVISERAEGHLRTALVLRGLEELHSRTVVVGVHEVGGVLSAKVDTLNNEGSLRVHDGVGEGGVARTGVRGQLRHLVEAERIAQIKAALVLVVVNHAVGVQRSGTLHGELDLQLVSTVQQDRALALDGEHVTELVLEGDGVILREFVAVDHQGGGLVLQQVEASRLHLEHSEHHVGEVLAQIAEVGNHVEACTEGGELSVQNIGTVSVDAGDRSSSANITVATAGASTEDHLVTEVQSATDEGHAGHADGSIVAGRGLDGSHHGLLDVDAGSGDDGMGTVGVLHAVASTGHGLLRLHGQADGIAVEGVEGLDSHGSGGGAVRGGGDVVVDDVDLDVAGDVAFSDKVDHVSDGDVDGRDGIHSVDSLGDGELHVVLAQRGLVALGHTGEGRQDDSLPVAKAVTNTLVCTGEGHALGESAGGELGQTGDERLHATLLHTHVVHGGVEGDVEALAELATVDLAVLGDRDHNASLLHVVADGGGSDINGVGSEDLVVHVDVELSEVQSMLIHGRSSVAEVQQRGSQRSAVARAGGTHPLDRAALGQNTAVELELQKLHMVGISPVGGDLNLPVASSHGLVIGGSKSDVSILEGLAGVGGEEVERARNTITRIIDVDRTRRSTLVVDMNLDLTHVGNILRVIHHESLEVLTVVAHSSRTHRKSRHLIIRTRGNTLAIVTSSSSLLLVVGSNVLSVDGEDLAVAASLRAGFVGERDGLPNKTSTFISIKNVGRMSCLLVGRNVRGKISSVPPLSVSPRAFSPIATGSGIREPGLTGGCST